MVATSRMTSLCAYLIAKCVCLQSDTYYILDFCLFGIFFSVPFLFGLEGVINILTH